MHQKVQVPTDILVDLSEGGASYKVAPSYFKVKSGATLLIMLDFQCSKESPKDSYSRKVILQSGIEPQTNIQAYSIKLSAGLNYGELLEKAKDDSCIIGITDDEEFQIDVTQAEDPSIGQQQEYLTPINSEKAWELAFSPTIGINKEVVVVDLLAPRLTMGWVSRD